MFTTVIYLIRKEAILYMYIPYYWYHFMVTELVTYIILTG